MLARRLLSNPFWALVVFAGTSFCITVLALLMLGHGDRSAPVNRVLDRYGARLIMGEVAVVLLSAIAALALDRRQSLRRGRGEQGSEGRSPEGG